MFVYLHGFNSSGQSVKAQELSNQLTEFDWLLPSYPAVPDDAVSYLSDYLQEHCPNTNNTILVGSSLGGFYAQYLARQFHTRVVLINPALDPITTLSAYLGLQTNYYSGEQYMFSETELNMLKQYEVVQPCLNPVSTLLLVDKGDEIIPYEYALEKYEACAECHAFDDGDHNFQHIPESVELIRAFERVNR